MTRNVVRVIGVILVVGALGMLGMFWGDAHSGFSPTYKAGVEREANASLALVKKLQAENAPKEHLDAAMTVAADRTNELADILRDENRHDTYWRKFYAIIAAAVILGLVALYFGFRKPRATAAS